MKEDYMKTPEPELRIRERPSQAVAIQIPNDTLASLTKVAERRDMSREALLRLYIGEGLRRDLSKLVSDRVLETTAEVLARHIGSEELSVIMEEIREKVTGG